VKLVKGLLVSSIFVVTVLFGSGNANASEHAQDVCQLINMPSEEWIVRTPFEVIDGRIYVHANVNDRGPFRFAVDTGASGMGRADSSLVSELGLTIHTQTDNSDGVTTSKADVTQFESLKLDGLVRKNLEVLTRDYSGKKSPEEKFSGIIGREFFEDGLLIIDYPNKTLYFSQSLAIPEGQTGVLQYERAFRVPVSIGELQTTGNLDTGANVTFVLPQSMYTQVSNNPLEKAGSGTLANTEIQSDRATIHGPFQIGAVTISDVEVRVSERYPELLVGAHVLQNTTVIIDQRSKSVALCQ
jgi:predicted aspartyl protease